MFVELCYERKSNSGRKEEGGLVTPGAASALPGVPKVHETSRERDSGREKKRRERQTEIVEPRGGRKRGWSVEVYRRLFD